jgi:hypothetical protein
VPVKGQRAGIEDNEKTGSKFDERRESHRWRCTYNGETNDILHGVYELGA